MSDNVISVENVSKLYRLGEVGTGTLSHDFNRWWHRIRGKEDPYLKIGQTNDRSKKGSSDYTWVLKDINFEVKRGEVLGIIGRNGAGKSTLLKILSRVTTPTTGKIKIKGRVASLLEVGTGFNPELTGRDNIYLNGAILGMRKREIDRKFDEIVAFSGVERYVDTPVKRYSSGMYVRLAFAVAAHLEPEILIVDEVLAVGDAEFQKKCLGKMKDVASHGRTILFVSHNIQAVSSLCSAAILMQQGCLVSYGGTQQIVKQYMSSRTSNRGEAVWPFEEAPGTDVAKLRGVFATDERGQVCSAFDLSEPVIFKAEFWILKKTRMTVSFHLYNQEGINLFALANWNDPVWGNHEYEPGLYSCSCQLPANFLNEGDHFVKIYLTKDNSASIIEVELPEVISFSMQDNGSSRNNFTGNWLGAIRPILPWSGCKI